MNIIPVTADELVQVLASDGEELDFKGIIFLCSQWGIKPVIVYPKDGGRSYYDWIETIRLLARHTQEVKP
jgi:hypothetical protein